MEGVLGEDSVGSSKTRRRDQKAESYVTDQGKEVEFYYWHNSKSLKNFLSESYQSDRGYCVQKRCVGARMKAGRPD